MYEVKLVVYIQTGSYRLLPECQTRQLLADHHRH